MAHGWPGDGPVMDGTEPVLQDSFPTNGGATWTVAFQSNGAYIFAGQVTAYAQCVQFSS
jgi:hypothetical protein